MAEIWQNGQFWVSKLDDDDQISIFCLLLVYYIKNELIKNLVYIVVDLFCGSGSTLICCETNNRKCRTIEMEEKFCDVTIQRWQNYTGKKATLESTGQTYEELKVERDV